MTPDTEEVNSTATKRVKIKRKKTNLSRSTRNAQRNKIKRRQEPLEKRIERNRKSIEQRRIKLSSEDPEEKAARCRREARRRRQYLDQKRQREKRERLNAVLESIESKDSSVKHLRDALLEEINEKGNTLKADIEKVMLKCDPCYSDTDSGSQISSLPVEVLLDEN